MSWHIAAAAGCLSLAAPLTPYARAAAPAPAPPTVAGDGLVSVRLASDMRRRPRQLANPDLRGGAPVYGGLIRLAAFDGQVRVITGYDGAAAAAAPAPLGRFGGPRRWGSSGLDETTSRERVEVDLARSGSARIAAFGRHRAAGARLRPSTGGLGPNQDSVGYGIDAAFNALSLRFGYDTCDSDGDLRTGAAAFRGASDSLRAALSLDALRPARGLGRRVVPARLGYVRTDKHRVLFDFEGTATGRWKRAMDKLFFDWGSRLGRTRLAIVRTRLTDGEGPAGGADTLVVNQTFGGRDWTGRLHLGFGNREAPHAATPWYGEIYSGGLAVTAAPAGLLRLTARIDAARFAMHVEPAARGTDWRLTTSLDFSALMPHRPGEASRLRLNASVGQGNPFAPTPDTSRLLDGALTLEAGFTF